MNAEDDQPEPRPLRSNEVVVLKPSEIYCGDVVILTLDGGAQYSGHVITRWRNSIAIKTGAGRTLKFALSEVRRAVLVG